MSMDIKFEKIGPNTKSLLGHTFGRLTVKSFAGYSTDRKRRAAWICDCSCGNRNHTVLSQSLTSGKSLSCGCYQREQLSKAVLRHGATTVMRPRKNWNEFNIWMTMRSRCNNPRASEYENYGGRGIRVCERWNESFENFLADMGPRPGKKFSIERKDNNGSYEPSNCIWATDHAQKRNTRSNRQVTYNGRTMIVSDWARELGCHKNLVSVLNHLRRLPQT